MCRQSLGEKLGGSWVGDATSLRVETWLCIETGRGEAMVRGVRMGDLMVPGGGIRQCLDEGLDDAWPTCETMRR